MSLSKLKIPLVAFVASLIFAFSNTFWSQSTISEVYTITAFFVILLLYLLRIDNFYLFMFFLGLGISHHHIILLLMPVSIVYFLTRIKSAKQLVYGLLLFVLGLLIYIYLPIRSIANPLIDWGNPENMRDFIRHITRNQYSFKTYYGHSVLLFFRQIKSYLDAFLSQFGIISPVVIILGVLGLVNLFKTKRIFFITSLIVFFAMTLSFFIMINFDITVKNLYVVDVFYIPSYLIFVIWVFCGLLFLLEKMQSKVYKVILPFVLVSFILPVYQVLSNFNNNDLSKSFYLEEYGKNILKTVEKDSVLFVSGDNPMFSLAYLQMVEKRDKDVKVYDDFGSVFKNIYGDNVLFVGQQEHDKIINDSQINIISNAKGTVYCTLGSNSYKLPQFEKIPRGLLYRIKGSESFLKNDSDPFIPDWINDKNILNDYFGREIVCRYYFAQGEYYLYNKDISKAKEYYLKALSLSNGIEWIETYLGNVFFKLGDKGESLESYKKVVENNKYNADAHCNLGVLYLEKGDLEKAENEFEQALKIKPYHGASFNNLGTIYLKRGDRQSAYNYYKKAISADPNQADAYSNLGSLYAEDGKYDDAIKEFNKTLELNPIDKKALNNLGVIYFFKGDDKNALQFLEKAVKIDPNNADGHNNLGSIYAKMNKIDLAVKEWKKALEIDPTHKNAKENLKKVEKR